MINVVLCGGSGTRLWPISRTLLPKQFVRLFDGVSLFQKTIERNAKVCNGALVVSNQEQYFLAVDQLSQLSLTHTPRFLLEPVGRNTAPAIALACLLHDPDDVILVTPSDHLIKKEAEYQQAVLKAKALAEAGSLVTFGIVPTHPETGFGYIEAEGEEVVSFTEKPDLETARTYLEQGRHYWNAGIFCFKAGVFLEELEKYAPDIYQGCVMAVEQVEMGEGRVCLPLEGMVAIPEESIDYAVMEKSDRVKVVVSDLGWSDLGSYDALYEEIKPEHGDTNAILPLKEGPKPICVDSKDNLIVTDGRQVALVNVDDLLVVDTADALLISHKGSSQKVKQVLKVVKETNPEMARVHQKAFRPWGSYEVLLSSEQYKIKRIIVKPGERLSLQKHFHRNEHWIVVSGTATVKIGDKEFLVRPNESTYIRMGDLHRLENQGKIDLVMIEVQVGEYTGEDDIVRVEDIYHRV